MYGRTTTLHPASAEAGQHDVVEEDLDEASQLDKAHEKTVRAANFLGLDKPVHVKSRDSVGSVEQLDIAKAIKESEALAATEEAQKEWEIQQLDEVVNLSSQEALFRDDEEIASLKNALRDSLTSFHDETRMRGAEDLQIAIAMRASQEEAGAAILRPHVDTLQKAVGKRKAKAKAVASLPHVSIQAGSKANTCLVQVPSSPKPSSTVGDVQHGQSERSSTSSLVRGTPYCNSSIGESGSHCSASSVTACKTAGTESSVKVHLNTDTSVADSSADVAFLTADRESW